MDSFHLRLTGFVHGSAPAASLQPRAFYRKEVSAAANPQPHPPSTTPPGSGSGSATRSLSLSLLPRPNARNKLERGANPPPTPTAETGRPKSPESWFFPTPNPTFVRFPFPVQRKLDEPPSSPGSLGHTPTRQLSPNQTYLPTYHQTRPHRTAPYRCATHPPINPSIHPRTFARALCLLIFFFAAPLPSPPSDPNITALAARSISEPGPYWIATSVYEK